MIDIKFNLKKISYNDIHWEDQSTIIKWCGLPYPRHPKGCPNTGKCKFYYKDLKNKLKGNDLHIIWAELNLDKYCNDMKEKHPEWSEIQLKNLLYWQTHVRSELRKFINKKFGFECDIYQNAEGGGINYYKTMKKFGIDLDLPKNLHVVRLIDIISISPGLEEFF